MFFFLTHVQGPSTALECRFWCGCTGNWQGMTVMTRFHWYRTFPFLQGISFKYQLAKLGVHILRTFLALITAVIEIAQLRKSYRKAFHTYHLQSLFLNCNSNKKEQAFCFFSFCFLGETYKINVRDSRSGVTSFSLVRSCAGVRRGQTRHFGMLHLSEFQTSAGLRQRRCILTGFL